MSTSNGERERERKFLQSTILKLLRPVTGNAINNCYFLLISHFLIGAAVVVTRSRRQNT
jgi:hypothetical protein